MNNTKTKKWIKRAAGTLTALMLFGGTVLAATPDIPARADRSSLPTKELTLDEAVKMALDTNPTGKIAVFDFEAAKGALTAARSARWPSITYTNNANWSKVSANYDNNPDNDNPTITRFSNYLNLGWVVWNGNKTESQISQAKLSLDSSQWGVAAARQLLKYNATDAFVKVMGARDSVKLNEESVARLEQYLKDVNLQFEVGVVAKVDVLRSEVALANARQTLIEARNTYDLTMSVLNNIIGLPLTTMIVIKADLGYSPYDQALAKCVDSALRQRPEIFQFTDAAKSAQEAITIAKAGYLPTVTASYQNGYYDTLFSIAGGNNYNWTAYVTTNWTLLDSGLTAGNVKKAVENYHKSQEQLRQTVDNVQLEVQSAYLSMKSAEQSIQTSKTSVGLAEEDYKIKVIRYQAGVGTTLDVLDAQLALTTAQNNVLQALYNYNNFRAKLDKAMGMPVN